MGRTGRRVVLVLVGLALVPSQGFGWGRDGHQVVANLAQSRLSPQARRGVAALLHGATLASVSTYADNYRNSHPETARWHYVNIPLDDGPSQPGRICSIAQGCQRMAAGRTRVVSPRSTASGGR